MLCLGTSDEAAVKLAWQAILFGSLLAAEVESGLAFVCDQIASAYGIPANTFTYGMIEQMKLDIEVITDGDFAARLIFSS